MTEENKTAAILVNSFGEEYFHDVNGSVFNKIGSVALFKKHFAEEIKQENTLYIILGTDSGLLPKYIHKTGVPDGTRYIFVEIPEILERLDKVIPEEGFDGRIIFLQRFLSFRKICEGLADRKLSTSRTDPNIE